MTDETNAVDPPAESDGWEWAVLEVFGHRRHAGRIREVEQFGAKMVRVDIPIFDAAPALGGPAGTQLPARWETRLYGGASIFSVSYTDEASVMQANRPYVSPYRISARPVDDDPDIPFDGDEGEGEP